MSPTVLARRREMSAFDQTRLDSSWERLQEQALRAFRARGVGAAKHNWNQAFGLSKDRFEWGDPRLATSCTNYAFSLLRLGSTHQGHLLLDEAVRCWEDSWRWVPLMVPPQHADRKSERSYTEKARQEFYALTKKGQAITEGIAKGYLTAGGLEDWREHKPKAMCDTRKLISAVFLMVSHSP